MKINSKIECHLSCLECSGGGINDCLSCNNNLYFYFGQCLGECPVGYYQESSSFQCNICPQTCLSCSSGIPFFFFFFFFLNIILLILLFSFSKKRINLYIMCLRTFTL